MLSMAKYLAPPLSNVQIFSKRPDAIEGDSAPIEFVVQRTGPVTNALTVAYNISGTATAGSDYSLLSGNVTIPAGAATASILATPLVVSTTENHRNNSTRIARWAWLQRRPDQPTYIVGHHTKRSAALPGGTVATPAVVLTNFTRSRRYFTQVAPTAPYSAIIQAAITSVPANRWTRSCVCLTMPRYNKAMCSGQVLCAFANGHRQHHCHLRTQLDSFSPRV